MTPDQQSWLAETLYKAVPDHEPSVRQQTINRLEEGQREALAKELAKEATAKGIPKSYSEILSMLNPVRTAGGNTDFSAGQGSDLYRFLLQLGILVGSKGTGCGFSCRSGGLTDSPHYNDGMIHMDNFNAHAMIPVGVTMHFFVDVFVGTMFYGDVPFAR